MDYFGKSAAQEVVYPGDLAPGSRGLCVRRMQEWLSFSGFRTAVDGVFGDASSAALAAFRARNDIPTAQSLDEVTWNALVMPMAALVNPDIRIATKDQFSDTVLKIATLHLKARPIEIGGENCGPWVRAYMSGHEGQSWPWCAGFVTAIAAQAGALLGLASPIPRTYSCDSLAKDAQQANRFVRGASISADSSRWASLGRCQIFLVRSTPNDWTHTGFAFNGKESVFETIEGNTNDNGSPEGFEVARRSRGSLSNKDFVWLDAR